MNKLKEYYQKRLEKQKNRKTSPTKIILFFGFYFFFFIFLAIFIKSVNSKINNIDNNDSIKYKTTLLENSNYYYTYTIYENNDINKYYGISNEINNDLNNLENKELFNIYNIKKLIKKSKYIDSNNNILNYEIDTETICEVFDISLKDILSKNNIILYLDNDKNIKKIDFDFTNYMKELKENIDLYKISIEYSF